MTPTTLAICTGLAAAALTAAVAEHLHRRDRRHPRITGNVIAARIRTVPSTSRIHRPHAPISQRRYELLIDNDGTYAWITTRPTVWDDYVTRDPSLLVLTTLHAH